VAKISLRQQRLTAAFSELSTLIGELAFERIVVRLTDEQQHWQFFFGNKHIADYWPASAKGQIVGQPKPVLCASAAQAQKLVIAAKKGMFKRIATRLRSGTKRKKD
jgi:hypothetical protein